MVMTVLEARVPRERADQVESVFATAMTRLPAEIVATYLVRDVNDPTLFRLNTVWRSRAALDATRAAEAKPKGIQMFEAVGASPVLTIFDVVVSRVA